MQALAYQHSSGVYQTVSPQYMLLIHRFPPVFTLGQPAVLECLNLPLISYNSSVQHLLVSKVLETTFFSLDSQNNPGTWEGHVLSVSLSVK